MPCSHGLSLSAVKTRPWNRQCTSSLYTNAWWSTVSYYWWRCTELKQRKTEITTLVSTYVLSSSDAASRLASLASSLPGNVWRQAACVAKLSAERLCLLMLKPHRELPRATVCLALKCQNQTSMVGVASLWLTTEVDLRESHWFSWRGSTCRFAHSPRFISIACLAPCGAKGFL